MADSRRTFSSRARHVLQQLHSLYSPAEVALLVDFRNKAAHGQLRVGDRRILKALLRKQGLYAPREICERDDIPIGEYWLRLFMELESGRKINASVALHERLDSRGTDESLDAGALVTEGAPALTSNSQAHSRPPNHSFLARAEEAYDVLARFLPSRVVTEDLSDALERISKLAVGASNWYLCRAFVSSCCVLLLNGAREVCATWLH